MQTVITVHMSLNYSLSRSSLSKGSIKRSQEHEFSLQMTAELGLNASVRIFRPTFLQWGHSLSVDMTSAQPPLQAAKVTHRSAFLALPVGSQAALLPTLKSHSLRSPGLLAVSSLSCHRSPLYVSRDSHLYPASVGWPTLTPSISPVLFCLH